MKISENVQNYIRISLIAMKLQESDPLYDDYLDQLDALWKVLSLRERFYINFAHWDKKDE
jgi:RNAse (barnase) inhibitor barstar